MRETADFIEAVKRNMPETIKGVKPHTVDYSSVSPLGFPPTAAIIPIYFISADQNSQLSLFVMASERDIVMNENDMDRFAKHKIASAIAAIPKDEPLFARQEG